MVSGFQLAGSGLSGAVVNQIGGVGVIYDQKEGQWVPWWSGVGQWGEFSC